MLEVRHLSVNYRGALALDAVDFRLLPGELVGLVGPNGAGKSTLLKAMLGLVRPLQGATLLDGRPIAAQRQRVAYVPQRSQVDWAYPVTAWQVVLMAQTVQAGWGRSHGPQAKAAAREALERLELWPLRHRRIGNLSGGQQQRVFLARALAQNPDVFFLDEPLAGVDRRTEAIVRELLDACRRSGKLVVACSHEWGEALQHYDRLLLLNRRLLADGPPAAVMTLPNIQRAYGQRTQPERSGAVASRLEGQSAIAVV